MPSSTTISALHGLQTVIDDVIDERCRQHVKWGEQNHHDVDPVLTDRPGGCTAQRMAEEYEIPTAGRAKFLCQNSGPDTWAAVLIEEVAEAVEAATVGTIADLRAELVQVAAVAVNWVQAIDRRERQNGGAA